MRRTLATLALLLAVATAGCGHDADPKVATADSGAPKARAGAAADGKDSPLKYSQCMRDQGLTWFPDPQADGGMKVSVPDGTNQNAMEKAEEACKDYAPGANRGVKISTEDLEKVRQMSQCIREHGFSRYPDPDSNGGIQIDSRALGVEPDDPAFEKARQECQKFLPPRKNRGNS
jgi:hypothetical protein